MPKKIILTPLPTFYPIYVKPDKRFTPYENNLKGKLQQITSVPDVIADIICDYCQLEQFQTTDEHGNLLERGTKLFDVREGFYYRYYPRTNGEITFIEANYKNGKLEGLCKVRLGRYIDCYAKFNFHNGIATKGPTEYVCFLNLCGGVIESP